MGKALQKRSANFDMDNVMYVLRMHCFTFSDIQYSTAVLAPKKEKKKKKIVEDTL